MQKTSKPRRPDQTRTIRDLKREVRELKELCSTLYDGLDTVRHAVVSIGKHTGWKCGAKP